jgi:hypothetical protein
MALPVSALQTIRAASRRLRETLARQPRDPPMTHSLGDVGQHSTTYSSGKQILKKSYSKVFLNKTGRFCRKIACFGLRPKPPVNNCRQKKG